MYKNIPTYVLAGPLGAGKTSMALHWLAQRPEGERWAVLVNEFGDIGLDAALLGPAQDGIAVAEVAGGCVCCVNGAPFTVALARLIRSARPQRLLIELSGLSHPLPLMKQLQAPPWAGVLALEPLMVVLDGPALLRGLRLPAALVEAMNGPCSLVINKADGVADGDRPLAERRLGRAAAWVTRGELDWSAVPVAALPAERGGLIFRAAGTPLRTLKVAPSKHQNWSVGWQLPPDQLLDRARVEAFLLRWPWQRAKGIIHSPQGWQSTNLLPGQPLTWRPSEWRRDSRLELIFAMPQDGERLAQEWAACQLAE